MEIKLFKKPKSVTIIEGFPGVGLIGTISTEFLLDHLKCEMIGKIWLDDIPPMIAIHEGKVVEPLGIFYNKKYNIVVIHGIAAISGHEWKIANAIVQVAKDLQAKEIISLEGVGSNMPSEDSRIFYYCSTDTAKKKFEKIGSKLLEEGIIMGVTGAMMIRSEKIPTTAIFAETQSNLPDSKAAAKVIEALDAYLGLKVNYKPLLEQAEKFEEKLKTLMDKSEDALKSKDQKSLSYVG